MLTVGEEVPRDVPIERPTASSCCEMNRRAFVTGLELYLPHRSPSTATCARASGPGRCHRAARLTSSTTCAVRICKPTVEEE